MGSGQIRFNPIGLSRSWSWSRRHLADRDSNPEQYLLRESDAYPGNRGLKAAVLGTMQTYKLLFIGIGLVIDRKRLYYFLRITANTV